MRQKRFGQFDDSKILLYLTRLLVRFILLVKAPLSPTEMNKHHLTRYKYPRGAIPREVKD
jgi:hypothetical protein